MVVRRVDHSEFNDTLIWAVFINRGNYIVNSRLETKVAETRKLVRMDWSHK